METPKRDKKVVALLVGLLVIILGAGILLFVPKKTSEQNIAAVTPTPTETPIPTSSASPTPEPTIAPTATPIPTPTPAATPQPGTYTMEQVKAHASASSCWSVVNGNVYDLTSVINDHKGGKEKILSMCGKDATKAFEDQHDGESKAENMLASTKIGTLR